MYMTHVYICICIYVHIVYIYIYICMYILPCTRALLSLSQCHRPQGQPRTSNCHEQRFLQFQIRRCSLACICIYIYIYVCLFCFLGQGHFANNNAAPVNTKFPVAPLQEIPSPHSPSACQAIVANQAGELPNSAIGSGACTTTLGVPVVHTPPKPGALPD